MKSYFRVILGAKSLYAEECYDDNFDLVGENAHCWSSTENDKKLVDAVTSINYR